MRTGNAALLRPAVHTIEPGKIYAQHLAVQKQQGAERLIVPKGRHMALMSPA
jgi:hypothetical protein